MDNKQAWIISVHGWGEVLFLGNSWQAEEWRRHKANWEQAVARKRPATEADAATWTGRVIVADSDTAATGGGEGKD